MHVVEIRAVEPDDGEGEDELEESEDEIGDCEGGGD